MKVNAVLPTLIVIRLLLREEGIDLSLLVACCLNEHVHADRIRGSRPHTRGPIRVHVLPSRRPDPRRPRRAFQVLRQ